MSGAADPDKVVAAITTVAGARAGLHEPAIAGREWEYVKECLDTGWVSTAGAFVDRFEAMLAETVGRDHAIATVNGTAALHTCLMLAGVGPGDEVLTPALAFVATANAITYCGASPHFIDSDPATLGPDPDVLGQYLGDIAVRDGDVTRNKVTGQPIRAMICVHTFGHPAKANDLAALADKYGLVLIEDIAEAMGTQDATQDAGPDGKRHVGSAGTLAAVSFNGNKIITTGGGGAVLTDDPVLAEKARHLTTTAKQPHKWAFDHDTVGFNYRLPNINAAMGCAQLEQLAGFVAAKRRLADAYRAAVADLDGVSFFDEPDGAVSNYWLNVLLLGAPDRACRDTVLDLAAEKGLQSRPAWTPLNRLPMFAECPVAPLPVADDLFDRLINIPSSVRLDPAVQNDRVGEIA